MKLFILLFLVFAFTGSAICQPGPEFEKSNKQVASLVASVDNTADDSAKIQLYEDIGFALELSDIEAALTYDSAAIKLANDRKWPWAQSRTLATLSSALRTQGKFAEALDALFRALEIAEENRLPYEIAKAYRRLGSVYFDMENFEKSAAYQKAALVMDKKIAGNDRTVARDHIDLANSFEKLNQPDSAIYYVRLALKKSSLIDDLLQRPYLILGNVYFKNKEFEMAKGVYYSGLAKCVANRDLRTGAEINIGLARIWSLANKKDSALYHALIAFDGARKVSYKKGVITSANLLAGLYEQDHPDTAIKYYKIANAIKDSIFGIHSLGSIQRLIARDEERRKQINEEKRLYQNKIKWYFTVAAVLVLAIISFILYHNNSEKRKANGLLTEQKQKLEHAMGELKATQALLIQSEKMASLAGLTAGIAHEIQNPLNFVNNFSEVNVELADDILLALQPYNLEEVKLLLNDVRENELRILHHGRRADNIVKGMLQHGRASSGKKQDTDINALVDKCLRISWHAHREKESSITIALETSYDPALGTMNIVPQDIGIVLQNIYSNAFDELSAKGKLSRSDYRPTVAVSTSRNGAYATIKIADNGRGIPEKMFDKIFQPFYTTKPTGTGTGLGLSLSYDIIKAHGGQISVNSLQGECAEFIISLPVSTIN